MNVSSGLSRIATSLKVLALLWLLLPLYGLFFGNPDLFGVVIFGLLPSCAVWVVGWIIEGFAKPK
ncbi:hypothetical protein [Cupriavidus oxalaticus]|uniref:hypothetical protein n=1 Tax=Cupriavidus oxalaticus TaxID=96344 RepID=UPI004033931E